MRRWRLTKRDTRRIRSLTLLLSWPELILRQMNIEEQTVREVKIEEQTVWWFEHGDFSQIRFQVNTTPGFAACVNPFRYRICTGFHEIDLEANAAEEADRLRDWLHADLFFTIAGRRKFRSLHPECSNYSEKRYAEVGLPYNPWR